MFWVLYPISRVNPEMQFGCIFASPLFMQSAVVRVNEPVSSLASGSVKMIPSFLDILRSALHSLKMGIGFFFLKFS